MIYSFEKLSVYTDAKELIKTIYNITKKLPNEEKYGLCSQIQRASISVASNIAEGSGRVSDKEKARFYEISYSSLLETLTQITVIYEIGFIDNNCYIKVRKQIEILSWKLNKLYKSKKYS